MGVENTLFPGSARLGNKASADGGESSANGNAPSTGLTAPSGRNKASADGGESSADGNAPSTGLISWTRTINEDDALSLLDMARPGQRLEVWEDAAHASLPQAQRPRRNELIKIVREELLDSHEGVIQPSDYLRLVQEGTPHRRVGLLYGRRLYGRPLVERAISLMILPALKAAEEPLAPHDAGTLTANRWSDFLKEALRRSSQFRLSKSSGRSPAPGPTNPFPALLDLRGPNILVRWKTPR